MTRRGKSEIEIVEILKEGARGIAITEICRKHGIHYRTYYKYKDKYEGMGLSEMRRLKMLETENRRLKHMYAELSLDHKILKDIIEKKFEDQ